MKQKGPLIVLLASCSKRVAGNLSLLLLGVSVSAYGQQQANELVPVTNDTVIAQVAGHEITIKDYQKTLHQLIVIATRGGDSMPVATIRDRGLDKLALDSLVNERLAQVEAETLGIAVTDDEVKEAIERMFTEPQSGQFVGQAKLKQMLAQMDETLEGYEHQTRLLLFKKKLRKRVVSDVKVSNAEVEKELKTKKAKVSPPLQALKREEVRQRLLDDRQFQFFEQYLKRLRTRYDAEGKIKVYQDKVDLFFSKGEKF